MPDRAERRGITRIHVAALAALGLLFAVPATVAAQGPQRLPTAPAMPSVASISLRVSAPAGRPCPGADRRSGARARRLAVGCLVNNARTSARLRGFAWDRALGHAATRHARDMARRGYFAHRRTGGPSTARRAGVAGFRGRDVGEAIAYGCGSSSTPAAVVGMWLMSPPHRAILLSRRTRAGIGVAGRPAMGCGGPGATYVLDAG